MRSLKRAFGALLVFALALQSCDNAYGIFSEVQKEIEQVGQDFFKKKSVSNIVSVSGNYYAATTILYSRPAAPGSSWSRMDIAGSSDRCVYGIAATATDLYVSTDGGVFSYDGTWTSIAAPAYTAPAGMSFYTDGIFAANNEVYVVGHLYDESDDTSINYYCLYLWNGASFDIVPTMHALIFGAGGVLEADETIRGVAYGGGANYWFAAEDHLYYSANETMSGATPVTLSDIWSIGSTRSGDVYIGTASGTLYMNGTADSKAVSTEGNPLSCVVEAPLNATDWKILVGTEILDVDNDTEGYFESQVALDDLADTTFDAGEDGLVAYSSSIYSTSVNDMPVHAFLYAGDLTEGSLFIAISSYASTKTHYGLYSSTWDGASWSGWQAE